MKTHMNVRRAAATLAVLGAAAGSFGGFAASAGAATGPTATLDQGTLTITGTPARDVMAITLDHEQLAVDFDSNGTTDARFRMSQLQRLRVVAGGGNDGVTVNGIGVGDIPITINGGPGNDGGGVVGNTGDFGTGDAPVTINGGDGNDNFIAATPGPTTVNAGAGDDRVDGGGAGVGHETINLGGGNDQFVSSANDFVGDRSDIVDGGLGKDAMEVDGSFASENANLSAKSGRLLMTDDRTQISADNVEDVSWKGFGGLDESGAGDSVSVGDLAGTDVVNFTPDFSAPADATAPNNSADQLRIVGTAGDDHIAVSSLGGNITVSGLHESVTPILLDSKDTLRIDTLAGRDTVDSTGLQPGLVQLQVF